MKQFLCLYLTIIKTELYFIQKILNIYKKHYRTIKIKKKYFGGIIFIIIGMVLIKWNALYRCYN